MSRHNVASEPLAAGDIAAQSRRRAIRRERRSPRADMAAARARPSRIRSRETPAARHAARRSSVIYRRDIAALSRLSTVGLPPTGIPPSIRLWYFIATHRATSHGWRFDIEKVLRNFAVLMPYGFARNIVDYWAARFSIHISLFTLERLIAQSISTLIAPFYSLSAVSLSIIDCISRADMIFLIGVLVRQRQHFHFLHCAGFHHHMATSVHTAAEAW